MARPIGNVSATFNASFQANGSDSLTGLPGVSLIVPTGDPFSPFGTNVALDRYVTGIPLTQHVASETAHAGVTLLGTLHHWNWSLTGNYDRVATRTRTVNGLDTSSLQAALNADDPTFDPFGSNLSYSEQPAADRPRPFAVQCRQCPARRQRHPVRSAGRARCSPPSSSAARRPASAPTRRGPASTARRGPFAHRRQWADHARSAAHQPPPPFPRRRSATSPPISISRPTTSPISARSRRSATASPGSRSRPSPCSGR